MDSRIIHISDISRDRWRSRNIFWSFNICIDKLQEDQLENFEALLSSQILDIYNAILLHLELVLYISHMYYGKCSIFTSLSTDSIKKPWGGLGNKEIINIFYLHILPSHISKCHKHLLSKITISTVAAQI